jgi:hypothetical protein
MSKPARGLKLLILIAGLALGGCQSSSPAPVRPAVQEPSAPASVDFTKMPGGNEPTASSDSIIQANPSASRLQDIGGYIMLFYRLHQEMPAKLQDLSSLPGGGELNFNSMSGQPFVYQSTGMWSPDRANKCIIAYDPELVSGKRWCLFMTVPKGGNALDVDVFDLPEPFFLNYQP